MDFPGSLTIQGPAFVEYMLDIPRSLIYQGFHGILLVHGHGSNAPWLEMVARLMIVEHPRCLCALINRWDILELQEAVTTLQASPVGGMSHAGELETSLMRAIHPQMVDMDHTRASSRKRYQLSNLPAFSTPRFSVIWWAQVNGILEYNQSHWSYGRCHCRK